MKLVTYVADGVERLGALVGDVVVDLNLAYTALLESEGDSRAYEVASARLPPSMMSLIEGGEPALGEARKALAYAEKKTNLNGGKKYPIDAWK